MGAERAEEFGRRNAVPGELVVRLRPVKVLAGCVPDSPDDFFYPSHLYPDSGGTRKSPLRISSAPILVLA